MPTELFQTRLRKQGIDLTSPLASHNLNYLVTFFVSLFVKKISCFEKMSFLTIILLVSYQTTILCLGIFQYIILFVVAVGECLGIRS